MLTTLNISNYALISNLEIAFSEGLSILTGETGAGKSILLGALSLLLGQRADSQVLKDPTRSAVVEATFKVAPTPWLRRFFMDNELEWDAEPAPAPATEPAPAPAEIVVRRVIAPTGKSRAFVNDQPVGLALLKDLGSHLVDIHSQHENLWIAKAQAPLHLVDAYVGNQEVAAAYTQLYQKVQDLEAQTTALRAALQTQWQEREYQQFQLEQLAAAKLQEGEQEELEAEQERLTHAQEIRQALFDAQLALSEGPQPVLPQLKDAARSVQHAARRLPEAQPLQERLDQAQIELKDIARELSLLAQTVQDRPQRLAQVAQRLDQLYTLQRKFHVTTVEELLQLQQDLTRQLEGMDANTETLERNEAQLTQWKAERAACAKRWHTQRAQALEPLAAELQTRLSSLGMPHAVVQFNLQETPQYGPLGNSTLDFLFSANKDMPPRELSKVASGGELSRLMLCVKTLMAQTTGWQTLIFDEIDTGVSGRIASSMGQMIAHLAQHVQVLAITHLPQVAGKGHVHYKVAKHTTPSGVQTTVTQLSEQERIEEMARLLSGENVSRAAIENAKELLHYQQTK